MRGWALTRQSQGRGGQKTGGGTRKEWGEKKTGNAKQAYGALQEDKRTGAGWVRPKVRSIREMSLESRGAETFKSKLVA